MTHQSESHRLRKIQDHDSGVQLAREARDKGDYVAAWRHAQAYGLNALDLADLGLPEKYRPKGFNPSVPKAEACVS